MLAGIRPRRSQLTDEKAFTQNHNCVVVKSSKHGITESCWVDTQQDDSILHYELAGNSPIRIDIFYKKKEQSGWVPSEWKVTQLSPKSKLDESAHARVTDYAFNPRFGEDTFGLDFPIGTEVQDYKRGENYIVAEAGTKRMITHEERMRGATYHDLATTESGMGALPQGSRNVTWLIFGTI